MGQKNLPHPVPCKTTSQLDRAEAPGYRYIISQEDWGIPLGCKWLSSLPTQVALSLWLTLNSKAFTGLSTKRNQDQSMLG